MAHDCPECFSTCRCGGDIDDINLGAVASCSHFLNPDCSGHDIYCGDDEDWSGEDDDV